MKTMYDYHKEALDRKEHGMSIAIPAYVFCAMVETLEEHQARIATLEAEKAELEKQEPVPCVCVIDGLVYLVQKGQEKGQRLYTKPQPPAVPDEVVAFLKELAKQTPEKPDYWSSCSQCEGSINVARDLLEVLSAAPKEVE